MLEEEIKIIVSLYYLEGFPVWRVPESILANLRGTFPRARLIKVNSDEQLAQEIVEADIIFGWTIPKEIFLKGRVLKWIHLASAGADRNLYQELIDSSVQLTSSRGVAAISIAEHALAMMLALTRGLHHGVRFHRNREWGRDYFWTEAHMDRLYEKTVGIIGLGSIGREISKRARAFGMRVIACESSPEVGASQVDELLKPGELPRLLGDSDYVITSIPLTPETSGLMGKEQFQMMKPTAYFINISRGGIAVESELCDCLKRGIIAGAGLDVFEREPLPPDSPLFDLENVILTPHIAVTTPGYLEKAADLFCQNVKKFLNGEQLINLIDKQRGF